MTDPFEKKDRETGLKLFQKWKGIRRVTDPKIGCAETILRCTKNDDVVILCEPGLGSKERVFIERPLATLVDLFATQ